MASSSSPSFCPPDSHISFDSDDKLTESSTRAESDPRTEDLHVEINLLPCEQKREGYMTEKGN